MVAVVTGNGLGLFNTSLNILGAAGSFGQGNLGQAGGKAWVNASTGNLILRFTDEQLSGQGQDLFHTRTYNTLGALNDADGDGWRWDGERRLVLSGTALTAGSSLTRTTGDGHQTTYTWNGSRYQSTDGDGAHDFIQWDGQNNEWYWTDGSTRSVERYNGSSGLLVSVRDTQGTLITYGYHDGKLSSVSDSAGQSLIMVYDSSGRLTRLDTRSSANGPLTSQVYYLYDAYGRLAEVKTDLTPDDNSTVDGQYYFTRYTYDGSSFRIASVVQSDGTSASFTYELVGGEYRVKTVNDASGTTTFTYVPAQRYTKVSNALNQEWVYTYDAKGQLTYVQSPAENGQVFYTGYQYDADGNLTRITDNSGNAVSYAYDERGNRVLERDPKGVTLARTYSASNQLLSEIHYSQPATWYAASATWGEPPASSAQVTRYVYDYADRLRFVVSATGSVAEYRYNANGLRVREIVYGDSRYDLSGLANDAAIAESTLVNWVAARDKTRSQVVTLNYDYRGNLNQRVVYAKVGATGEPVLDDTTSLTEYVYSQHGQLLQTVVLHGTSRPVLSSSAYDGMGRLIAQMDASGTRTTVYDGQQRSIAVTTASGLVLTQVYDPLGRLVRIEESTTAGNWRGNSYYVYDAAGRLVMKEDATGVRSYTFYDALGRVAAEVDGTGSITRYSYNQKDQRISALAYATQANTGNWFSAGVVTVSLAQILPASTPADRLTRLDYDGAGRLLNSIDGAGTVTRYEYDGRGQLVRQQTGQRVTRTFYDADGRQTGQLDAEGYLRENVYNAAGQLQQVIRYAVATTAGLRASGSLADLRPAGASLSTWNFHDGAGRQVGSVDEQGFVTETVYNESANTTQSIRYATAYTAALSTASSFAAVRDAVRNGASQVLTTAYDGQGRVLSRTATDGSVTTFEYDAAGRLVKETSAAGTAEERSTRTLYDAFGQTTGKLLGEASGRITAGMSAAEIKAVYSQYGSTWNYDAAGRVASVTDALGNRTLSYYDAAGRLTRVINALGEVSETRYNAFGDAVEKGQLANRLATGGLVGGLQPSALDTLLAAIRNANIDSRTTYGYDTRGLLLTSIDAEGISTTNQYDQYGQLQRQIRVIAGSRTVTSAYGYNLRGERISQTRDAGGLNLTDSTTYDAFGRVVRSTDAAGNLSTSEYRDNGRTLVVRDPLNNSRRTELDAFGRTLKDVDALGNVTTYSYDDVNRSVVVTLPDGSKVSTWKTRHGDTLKVVDAKGDATRYEYNREGQLTRTIDALGQAEVKRYDKAGRLSESVDARGVVTHLDYDAANRVVQRSVDPTGLNQRTTYEFDTSGRQVRVVDAAGTLSARVTENRYDRKGQLLQTVVDPNGLQLSTRYVYDGLGNVLRISQGTVANPEQRVTDYVYNAAGQRRFSIDALGYVTERSYDAAGNVLQETRYANRYAGARDAATLQRLGTNLLNNVAFASPQGNGVPQGWGVSSLPPTTRIMVNPDNAPNITARDLPAGDSVVQMFQNGTSTAEGYQDLYQIIPQVRVGQRYAFSAYTATINANAEVYIAWVDASGNWVGASWATPGGKNLDEVHGGTSLADYKRLEVVGQAPEGAVSALVVVRKSDTLAGFVNSQVLVAHAQFEALESGSSASSTWARPLASADDRVTNYVYDALGRQRFSVDALGYVSERSYDANGNLTQETRYANKLSGPRDIRTLQKLGTNLLNNVAFANPGSNGVPAGWTTSTLPSGTTVSVNPTNSPSITAQDLPAGDGILQVYQNGRQGSGYQELFQQIPQVSAGQKYAFSVYTAAINANAEVYIGWIDASGKWFDYTPATAASQTSTDVGGPSLANYKRLEVIGQAPAGAVRAFVAIRKSDTKAGYTASLLQVAHAQFEVLDAAETASGEWSRPLQTSADDRVTNHVYDDMGRQRFSVDALGYVSERRYDAVGNVIQETRYANKLSGPRDASTLQALGNNLLSNVTFANPGSNGVPAGWTITNLSANTTATVNPTNAPSITAQDLPPGDGIVQVYQTGREGTGSYPELQQLIPQVKAGQRYAFSAYTAMINATTEVYIGWIDANGNWFANTSVTPASQYSTDVGGPSLANYKRLEAIGVAPEGAVRAFVAVRKSDTKAGATASLLQVAHAQFEALDAAETTSSAWARPQITSSADDRVTNYVYDALGRQRFSVDALGYVTERRYDAVGNVIQETRYANKLSGPRDTDTLQKLGSNLLSNVTFANPGSNGVPAGWVITNLSANTTATVNPTNAPSVTAQDLPAGDGIVQVYQTGREGTGSFQELQQFIPQVSAGQRYSFSAYTAMINANAEVYIGWIDANGRTFSNTTVTPASQYGADVGGPSLSNYKRLEAIGVAPEGAVSAFVAVRKYDTKAGYTASLLQVAHAQFEALDPGETTSSTWARPQIISSADDRVTNYVYDALGRQRFSVDALGYVTERRYDAVGNVTQETRYANKLSGPRDTGTLQKLGSNLLNNTAFAGSGSNGVPAGWAITNLSANTTATVNPTNAPSITAQDLPSGDGIVQVYQTGREGTGSFQELQQFIPQVSAGQRYSFSAYTAMINANAEVYIGWIDANGTTFSNTPILPASQYSTDVGGPSLSNYKRLEAIGVAPEGAVSAFVAVRKHDTKAGYTASLLQVAHAQFEALDAGEAAGSTWTRSLITASADDRVTNYVYDALGRQRFSVDALGYVSERTYDGLGNVVQETLYANALSGPRDAATLQKLETGNLKQAISGAADRTSQSSYDATGRLLGVKDPLGYSESYTYDAFGNRTSLTNKNGQTWSYRYDRIGQLFEEITPPVWISSVSPGGAATARGAVLVTRNEYNAFGNIVSRSEGRQRTNPGDDPALDDLTQVRTATYGYDALGRQIRITSPGWYVKDTGQFQQASDGTGNTFQVTTDVTYDGLGNAVRNRVRVNNTGVAATDYVDSYKAYDLLGQVRYEVDALKGVTVHEYDGFGQETLTRRHASALNAGMPASGYYQLADFTAASLPRDAANDRTLITRYDSLGRKTEVQQDIVSLYNFTGIVATSALKNAAPVKAYGYNGFGEVTRETLLARDVNGVSVMEQIITVNYYDRAGRRIGTVDALGYYTRLEYTASGKVSRQVEYATALGNWNEGAIPAAQASTRDRSVRFAYDNADRLVQTTQENVTYWQQTFVGNEAPGRMTQVTGDVMVSRSTYDGVGNVRTLTDAAGSVTTTEYNALGQVQKVIEPARYSANSGSANPFAQSVYVSPVVEYSVNAFGQVVYEQRSAGPGQAGLTQVTRTVYDAAGHEVKEFDAAGSAQSFKVDVAGRRLEESREITTNLSGWRYNDQTIRRTFTYDSLGQQLGATDWYTEANVQKSTTNAVVYNRFGEVTAELLNGNAKASYRYNQIGNAIQQTNAQGVTQVDYDLTGKASRSVQLGNLATSADDRITYIRNDLLGRVLEQHLPAFEANVSGDTLNSVNLTLATPIIRQASDRWGNVLSRTDARGYVTTYSYDHNNQVLTETLPETDILRENGTSYRASLIHEKRYDALGRLIEEADRTSAGSAPLRTRQHVYNAAGDLVRDIDALGASRYYAVDAHGNRIGTLDPLGIATFDEYDAMDRHVRHGVLRGGERITLLTKQYDQAGRLYAEIDGTSTVQETLISTRQTNHLSQLSGVAGNTRFSLFDERGNIVETRNESNIQKTFVFNDANRKVKETDGLGKSLTWTYNEGDYGRLVSHEDLAGRNYSYVYNNFGQVVSENSDKTYTYYANGLLKAVAITTGAQRSFVVDRKNFNEQWQSIKTSTYAYDLLGNKVSDALTTSINWFSNVSPEKAGATSTRQENRYKFDEVGRLVNANALAGTLAYGTGTFTFKASAPSGREHIVTYSNDFHYSWGNTTYINLSYKFDEFGNRRRVTMDSLKPNGWDLKEDNWFKYDLNDHAVVVDGFFDNGAVVAGVQGGLGKGYTLSYDAAGRRASSERWESNASGQALYVRSEYSYNDLNQVASRSLRNVYRQSGANSNAAVQSMSAGQLDLVNSYDERGRVVTQATYKSGVAQSSAYSVYRGDNQKISEVTYTYTNGVGHLAQANYFGEAGMIDSAGNQTLYRYATFNTSGVATQLGDYQTAYVGYETYKSATLTASATGSYQGVTTYVYNDRGDLLHLSSNTRGTYRRFAVDGDARMIGAEDAYTAQAQIYLNYQNGSLANAGGLSLGAITDTLVPISENYPAQAPSSYVVNQGDTLESIAQAVWGDRSMWYLIADANGKDLSDTLVVGSSLRIPNVVSSNRNDATTFKPYNPAEVIGDTITPPTPPKPKKKKCNAVASIVMVVVAVVATVFTAGAAGAVLAGAASSLSTAAAAGVAAFSGTMAATGLSAVAAFGIGAAVGSVASQAAGMAMGVVDSISWKQVAVAGLGGAIGAGITSIAAGANSTLGSALDAVGNSSATWQQVAIAYGAQGVAGYAGSYIASKAVGLESSFSWKNMAASAIGSIVAGSINQNSGFLNSTIRGQVSAHSSAWMRDKWFGGGRPDYGQVAADAFGNSLMDYALAQMRSSASGRQRNAEADEKYRYAFASVDVDAAQGYMSTDTPIWRDAVDPDLKFLAEVRGTGWFGLEAALSENGDDFGYAPLSLSSDVPILGGSSEAHYPQAPQYGFFEGVDNYIYANGVFDRPIYDGGILTNTLTAAVGAGKLAVNIAVSGLVYSDEFLQETGLNKITDPLIAYSGIGLVGGEVLALARASKAASMAARAGQGVSEWFSLRSEIKALESASVIDSASGAIKSPIAAKTVFTNKGVFGADSYAFNTYRLEDFSWDISKGIPEAVAPKTLSRMDELREKWNISASERWELLQVKAEANAYRRLKELESATPGAHFLGRHGAHLDLESQYNRAAYGIDPTTGEKGRVPPSATRFLSHRDQLSVIMRADAIFNNTGSGKLANANIMRFDSAVGDGYSSGDLVYGYQYSGKALLNKAGKVITAYPIYER